MNAVMEHNTVKELSVVREQSVFRKEGMVRRVEPRRRVQLGLGYREAAGCSQVGGGSRAYGRGEMCGQHARWCHVKIYRQKAEYRQGVGHRHKSKVDGEPSIVREQSVDRKENAV